MRDKLRLEIIRRFRSQVAAAHELDITEPRLSRIINGWVNPTPCEREKLAAFLGPRRLALLLRAEDKNPAAAAASQI